MDSLLKTKNELHVTSDVLVDRIVNLSKENDQLKFIQSVDEITISSLSELINHLERKEKIYKNLLKLKSGKKLSLKKGELDFSIAYRKLAPHKKGYLQFSGNYPTFHKFTNIRLAIKEGVLC